MAKEIRPERQERAERGAFRRRRFSALR